MPYVYLLSYVVSRMSLVGQSLEPLRRSAEVRVRRARATHPMPRCHSVYILCGAKDLCHESLSAALPKS